MLSKNHPSPNSWWTTWACEPSPLWSSDSLPPMQESCCVSIWVQSLDIRSADSWDGKERTFLWLLGWPKVAWICPAVTSPVLCPTSCPWASAPAAEEEHRAVKHISQLLAGTVRGGIHLDSFTSPSFSQQKSILHQARVAWGSRWSGEAIAQATHRELRDRQIPWAPIRNVDSWSPEDNFGGKCKSLTLGNVINEISQHHLSYSKQGRLLPMIVCKIITFFELSSYLHIIHFSLSFLTAT